MRKIFIIFVLAVGLSFYAGLRFGDGKSQLSFGGTKEEEATICENNTRRVIDILDSIKVSPEDKARLVPTRKIAEPVTVTKTVDSEIEQFVIDKAIQGEGPTADGVLSADEIGELYTRAAINSGSITAEEALEGANTYEEIRK